jgi:hypothetical protein
MLGKNDPMPETYRNFPYQYDRLRFGVLLRKNLHEVFLYGDDETLFLRECNRAKQKGRDIAAIIEAYFTE